MTSTNPVPFIQVDQKSGKLVVTEDAKVYLSKVKGSIGVCSVAGVYRTGKSYILNQLAGKDSGFGIGSSVQACTRGIWLWGAPLSLSGGGADGTPEHLLLLDTEGLQSISQTEGHDAKIFCLAILLSSYFVYNSEKAINNAAIDQLSLVAQLTHKIRVRAESGEGGASGKSTEQLSDFFPTFLWLLRDFQLELEDERGAAQSADEYLEACLQSQGGSSAAVKERNETREAIRSLFRHRSCVTLRHPTLGTGLPDSALKQLPSIDKLHPAFREGVLGLKRTLFTTIKPKTLHGVAVNGPMLLNLASAYADAINGGAIPTISTAWQAVLTIECQRAFEAAADAYRKGVRAAAAADPPPDAAQWLAAHEAVRAHALALFSESAIGKGSDALAAKLEALFAEEKAQQETHLSARSAALCGAVVSRLGTEARAYSLDGGKHGERLLDLFERVLSAYEQQAAGSAKAEGRAALLGELMATVKRVVAHVEGEAATAADKGATAAAAAEEAKQRLAQAEAAARKSAEVHAELQSRLQKESQLAAQLPPLRAHTEQLQNEAARLARQLEATEGERRAAAAAAASGAKEAAERLSRAEAANNELRASQREAAAAATAAATAAAAADKRAATEAEAAARAARELAAAKEEANALATEAAGLRTAVAGTTTRTESMQAEIGQLRSQLQEVTASKSATATSLSNEMTKLKSQLAEAASAKSTMAANLQAEIAQLRSQLAEVTSSATATSSGMQGEIARLTAQLDEARALGSAVKASAEAEVAKLKSELANAESAQLSLTASMQGEIAQLRSQLEEARRVSMPPPPPPEWEDVAMGDGAEVGAKRLRGSGSAASASSRASVGREGSGASFGANSAANSGANGGAEAVGMEEEEKESSLPDFSPPSRSATGRRSSVMPTNLAVPALQAKLRAKLGQKAKLPKKREELVALYTKHCLLE